MQITVYKRGFPEQVFVNNHVGYDHDLELVESIPTELDTNIQGYDLYKCGFCGYEEAQNV